MSHGALALVVSGTARARFVVVLPCRAPGASIAQMLMPFENFTGSHTCPVTQTLGGHLLAELRLLARPSNNHEHAHRSHHRTLRRFFGRAASRARTRRRRQRLVRLLPAAGLGRGQEDERGRRGGDGEAASSISSRTTAGRFRATSGIRTCSSSSTAPACGRCRTRWTRRRRASRSSTRRSPTAAARG